MARLNRTLGLAEATFFGVGSILGAGIYALIGKVAAVGGNMTWLSFAIASVTALMSAFSYAELSSMYPKAAAEYYYVKNSFNQRMALVLGMVISMNGILSGATVSIGFAGYLSQLWDINLFIGAAGIICLVWLVNSRGIRQSSVVNIVFTIIEFAGLMLVVYVAWPYLGKVDYLEVPPGGFNNILLGAALSYFAYIGFEEIVKLSEETREPGKNIPRALFIATGIVMVVYLLIAFCVVSVINWQELGKSAHPLSDVVGTGLGKAGITAIAIIALFSTTNTILSNMIGSSRVLYELGEEFKWLKPLSFVSERTKIPLYALILVAVLMVAAAAIGNLATVALIANFFIFITFLFVNLSVIILRVKQKNKDRPFRIPLNIANIPVPSVLGVILTLILLGYSVYGLILGGM